MKFVIIFLFFISNTVLSSQKLINNIRISDKSKNDESRIVLELNNKVPYSLFVLDNSPRLVVDIEADKYSDFNVSSNNLIKNIRLRRTEKGVVRVVFDLKKKSFIKQHFFLDNKDYKYFRLVIDIETDLKKVKAVKSNKRKKKFIITVDPGHGGIDPGAVRKDIKEKDLTLKASKELGKILRQMGYKVYLTREKDVFIPLHMRRKKAKNYNSDLFISIHVDSVRKKSTRGTSIYTLSDRASDKVTAKLAERENKADLIAGINLDEVDNEVASILLDLKRRDTKNSSALFAEQYVNFARKNGHKLLKRPHRHAGFAVLKSPDIPSVLIELGFLSNIKDVKLLINQKSRYRLLQTLASAIDKYIKNRKQIFN